MAVQETSAEAYKEAVEPNLSERQNLVMRLFRRYPYSDFTNQEIAEHLGWPINTVTPRVLELRSKALLVAKTKRIDQKTGRRSIAWGLNV